MNIETALSEIKEPWFVYAMGEQVQPVTYKGDMHEMICYYCDLQHRNGGRKTSRIGPTLSEAINTAWQRVQRNWND